MRGFSLVVAVALCCVSAAGCVGPPGKQPGVLSVPGTPTGSVTATGSADVTSSTATIPSAVEQSQSARPPWPTQLHHPALGSTERKAILDGLRPAVERDLGQKVIFEVKALNVARGFAFVEVVPRRPSGAKIDYLKTRHRSQAQDGVLDGGSDAPVWALLRNEGGGWKVLTFEVGPTDVAYADWWSRFKAPKAIFPYTE
jgi:hypothetical protein